MNKNYEYVLKCCNVLLSISCKKKMENGLKDQYFTLKQYYQSYYNYRI